MLKFHSLVLFLIMFVVCITASFFPELVLAAETTEVAGAAATPSVLVWVWEFAQTPFALAIVAGAVLYLLTKMKMAKPELGSKWDKYKPAIINAIKRAEKMAELKGHDKLETALEYVLKVHEQVEHRAAAATDKLELAAAIALVKEELEQDPYDEGIMAADQVKNTEVA